MKTLNIHEAKTQLSRLLEEVQNGEEVIIAKAGKPIAKLSAYTTNISERKGGLLAAGAWESEDAWEEDKDLNEELTNSPLYSDIADFPKSIVAEEPPNS
jgi:prevent-host-death family protein